MIERKNKMKLYFYILDSKQEFNAETRTFGKPIFQMKCEECEVVENPKTYKPVDKFPKEVHRSFIHKRAVGGFLDDYGEIVVLDERNYEKAKERFLNNYNYNIKKLKKKLSTYENMIAAVEVGEENCK